MEQSLYPQEGCVFMRKLKRLLAVCLMVAMLPVGALCDSMLLPQLEGWQLGVQPLQISMQVQAESVPEFDENRLNQFNALLKHLTFSLQYQESASEQWGSVGVAVDGDKVLSLTVNETADRAYAQLSCVPDKTYASASGKDIGTWLLGGAETAEVLSLDGLLSPWLDNGYAVFEKLPDALAEYTIEKSVKTKIGQMGTARVKQTVTIPADAAGTLSEKLSALSNDAGIAATLSNAVFSGKQTITIFCDEDGQMLKVTYTGRCGADEDHLRKVNLTWMMKRTEKDVRDSISLKTPAVKGNDYNTLTFNRTEKADEYGTVDLDASLTHNSRIDSKRTSVTAEADLEAMLTAEGTRLSGEITRSLKENSGDTQWLILEPELVFAADDLHMTGTMAVETRTEKRTENRYLLSMEMTFGSYFEWLLHENMVDMDAIAAETSVRDEFTAAIAQALIRPLVLLPYEDTLYLSDGLEPDVWQSIVEKAREAIQGGY